MVLWHGNIHLHSVKCKKRKMQKCNVLIFNLLQNPSLHFLQKKSEKAVF